MSRRKRDNDRKDTRIPDMSAGATCQHCRQLSGSCTCDDATTTPQTKTPSESPPMRVPQHGRGRLRIGNPNNAGRSRSEFKAKLRELVSDDAVLAYLHQCLLGREGAKHAIAAWRFMAEHGYGAPAQRVGVSMRLDEQTVRLLPDEVIEQALSGVPLEIAVANMRHALPPSLVADAELFGGEPDGAA